MKKRTILGSTLCFGLLAACSSSSSTGTMADSGVIDTGTRQDAGNGKKDTGAPHVDAGKDTGVTHETGTPKDSSASDVVVTVDGGPARWLLVTYASASPTTTFAIDLDSKHIDGTITTTDFEAITDTSNGVGPFLLDQTEDRVAFIDPSTWTLGASWATPLPVDGGGGGSDAYAVVLTGLTNAYVVRYLSNVIDVIDVTQTGDAGAVTASVDLSSLVQADDADGLVEATAAAYVPSSKLLYVVLGNVNRYATDDYMGSFDTICGPTTSSVIAIDTTTNMVKSLNGAAQGGGIALHGYDPTSAIYDAANNRLLVQEAGCNPAPTVDGGAPGSVQQRGIEAVDLTANTSATLVDTSDKGFPGSFVYIDAHHAVVGFSYPDYEAYQWDPTLTSLASKLPNAPNVFDYDGEGNLVGASINYPAGGAATTDVVSMALASGMVTTLVPNIIAPGNGYISSVGVWPRP